MNMTDLSTSAGPLPDLAEINNIVQDNTSPAEEMNKKITNAYHQLSLAAQKALNADNNLDWCGFAKWASHRVGQDLDHTQPSPRAVVIADDVVRSVDPVLTALNQLIPAQNLHDAIHDAVEELVRNDVSAENGLAAKALRGGNAHIFNVIGSIFVRLLERLGQPDATLPQSEDGIHEIANEIVPQRLDTPDIFFEPPIDSTMLEDAQRGDLMWAVHFYLRAAQEADQDRKGEFMLAGSMMFTQYEQKRVDHLITIATCAPIRSKLIDLLNHHLRGSDVSRQELLLAKRGTSIRIGDLLPIVLRLRIFGQATNGSNGEKTKLIQHIVSSIEEELITTLTQRVFFLQIADRRVDLGLPEQLPHPPVRPIVPTLPDVKVVMDFFSEIHKRTWIGLGYRLEFIAKYFAAFQRDPNPLIQQNPELQQSADTQQT
jgi:hypothetical protein